MARGGFAMFGTQRFEQLGQTVMVDLLHQCKQSAEFAVRETFTGEPVQVRAWQVGDDPALVLAEGHFSGDQQFEFFGIHQKDRLASNQIGKYRHSACRPNDRSCK